MSSHPSFPSLLESFFRHRMAKQRNASPATINSYRDALRMLILFAAGRAKCKPSLLTINDLDRDAVLGFLDDLETTRGNSIQTRNARLAAIRSFFQHVAANDPASFGIAHRVGKRFAASMRCRSSAISNPGCKNSAGACRRRPIWRKPCNTP